MISKVLSKDIFWRINHNVTIISRKEVRKRFCQVQQCRWLCHVTFKMMGTVNSKNNFWINRPNYFSFFFLIIRNKSHFHGWGKTHLILSDCNKGHGIRPEHRVIYLLRHWEDFFPLFYHTPYSSNAWWLSISHLQARNKMSARCHGYEGEDHDRLKNSTHGHFLMGKSGDRVLFWEIFGRMNHFWCLETWRNRAHLAMKIVKRDSVHLEYSDPLLLWGFTFHIVHHFTVW